MTLFGAWVMTSAITFILGLYLFLVGINYASLLFYAVAIVRKGSARSEVDSDSARSGQNIKKYGSQQFLILIPLAILAIALVQEIKK